MAIQCFVHFQGEKPYNVGVEVLLSHYVGKDTPIRGFETSGNQFEIILNTQIYERLVFDPGPPATVTYRKILPRMR
jgi:hypothetical protein